MELRQLRTFIAAAEELHFQRAARRVNLSQPALSHQIKALEEEVGVTLLARDRRSVSLTPAGDAFVARAREAVGAADAALRDAREAAGAEPDVLRLGFVSFLNLRVITRSIAAFRASHPDINVEQIEMATTEVYAALKERTIDLGFGVLPVTHPTLKFRKVADGYWSVIVSDDHPFAADEAPLSSLQDQPLVIFARTMNPTLYDSWMARFEAAGFEPKIVLETTQVQTGISMAGDGAAAFVVASYIVDPVPPGLARVRLTGFDNAISVGAAWHEENHTLALADYLSELRAVAR